MSRYIVPEKTGNVLIIALGKLVFPYAYVVILSKDI